MPQDSRPGTSTKEKNIESRETYRIPDNRHCRLALHDLASSAGRKSLEEGLHIFHGLELRVSHNLCHEAWKIPPDRSISLNIFLKR